MLMRQVHSYNNAKVVHHQCKVDYSGNDISAHYNLKFLTFTLLAAIILSFENSADQNQPARPCTSDHDLHRLLFW